MVDVAEPEEEPIVMHSPFAQPGGTQVCLSFEPSKLS